MSWGINIWGKPGERLTLFGKSKPKGLDNPSASGIGGKKPTDKTTTGKTFRFPSSWPSCSSMSRWGKSLQQRVIKLLAKSRDTLDLQAKAMNPATSGVSIEQEENLVKEGVGGSRVRGKSLFTPPAAVNFIVTKKDNHRTISVEPQEFVERVIEHSEELIDFTRSNGEVIQIALQFYKDLDRTVYIINNELDITKFETDKVIDLAAKQKIIESLLEFCDNDPALLKNFTQYTNQTLGNFMSMNYANQHQQEMIVSSPKTHGIVITFSKDKQGNRTASYDLIGDENAKIINMDQREMTALNNFKIHAEMTLQVDGTWVAKKEPTISYDLGETSRM